MILRSWTTDEAGDKIHAEDDWDVEVANPAMASAHLASELSQTASDVFLHDALSQWFTDGKIEKLHEGNNHFWNVELTE